jgi:hypothetical protein
MSRRSVREGLVVGLIAYASVAAFYVAFDALAARGPLYTVNLLGKVVFRGLRDPAVLQFPLALDPTVIFWYNAFHLVVSLAIGPVVTSLVFRAARQFEDAPVILSVIVAGFVVTVFGVGFLTVGIRPLLPWWSILIANVLATLAGGVYLMWRYPLWRSALSGHRPAVS